MKSGNVFYLRLGVPTRHVTLRIHLLPEPNATKSVQACTEEATSIPSMAGMRHGPSITWGSWGARGGLHEFWLPRRKEGEV